MIGYRLLFTDLGFEPIEKLDLNKEEMIGELNFASESDNGHECAAPYYSYFSSRRQAEKYIKENSETATEANCVTCGRDVKDDEELQITSVGILCQSCYSDGLTDQNMYMELYKEPVLVICKEDTSAS